MTVRQSRSVWWIWVAALAACGPIEQAPEAEQPAPPAAEEVGITGDQAGLACEHVERMPLEGRPSPLDSALVDLDGVQVKVCYGGPSMRGREIFGGLVPYDTLWRTGANEPTTIHLPAAVEVAGMALEPGSYSLYTVPGPEEWAIVLNRSTSQWGIESQYTSSVRAQEVGRSTVPAGRTEAPVERFTIRGEPTGPDQAALILEWEETRVRIPLRRL